MVFHFVIVYLGLFVFGFGSFRFNGPVCRIAPRSTSAKTFPSTYTLHLFLSQTWAYKLKYHH